MKNHITLFPSVATIAVMVAGLTGCFDYQATENMRIETIDISEKYEINKQSAIADALPGLESSIKHLESVCAEIQDDGACNKELSILQAQVESFGRGEWQDIPTISLEKFSLIAASVKQGKDL